MPDTTTELINRAWRGAILACVVAIGSVPVHAQTMQVKDANGTTITVPTLPGIGQKASAASLPVVLPSDMAPLAVTPTLPSGASSASNQISILSALATIAGNLTTLATATAQTTTNAALATANGYLAIIATNSANFGSGGGSGGAGSATAANQTTGNTSLATLVTQTAGLATAAAQTTANTSLVTIATNTAKLAAIAPIASTAAEAAHVLKASAGNLYGYAVTSGSSAGYVMIFDAATVPADGAVTPKHCEYLPANNVLGGSAEGDPPESYAIGIVVVFSSTGCFTKTAQTAMFIRGRVQ